MCELPDANELVEAGEELKIGANAVMSVAEATVTLISNPEMMVSDKFGKSKVTILQAELASGVELSVAE